jgi:hypothetical protein
MEEDLKLKLPTTGDGKAALLHSAGGRMRKAV